MNENESKYYSTEEIRKIQERGVQIPDLRSVLIARDVEPENILPGCIIHPCSRISGAKTQIHSSTHIGVSGPATIENSWIGENAIVGNLGPVTLKETVVGPQTILGSGVAENAVFLGKEAMINDFTTGFGFRVRKGSLYEEDSSSAQHTDTKNDSAFSLEHFG